MSYFIENETYLQCPYDKSHQILNYRFQTHLVKCAKNHPDKNLIVCPFNSTHLYSKENLSEHVKTCPDRASFEMFTVNFNTNDEVLANVDNDRGKIIQQQILENENEENWDDINEPTYDPTAYVTNAPVLRKLHGAKKSERKAFREAERIRLNNLQNSKN